MTDALIEVRDLVVQFRTGAGTVQAVNHVSLALRPGETLGLVGESGCGKSTLGRAMMGLVPLSGGVVRFDGQDVADRAGWANLRRRTAMIFQDPLNSLNPRARVGDILAEVLRVHGRATGAGIRPRVEELLTLVGLRAEFADRRPGTLSGGQCQRVGIARALAIEPKLIIADECVAALDVSIQAQIINLLIELKAKMGLALIFIAHDLALVRRLCDRVAVMYLGRIVEEGPVEDIFGHPLHPYSDALVQAIPEIDPDHPLPEACLAGEPPSPLRLPLGCPLHPRCPKAFAPCADGRPPDLFPVGGRSVACLLHRPAPAPARADHP
jgi:peptide/nickel transport system ATP-binding protein